MRINKKALTILAFSLGACVFVSSAMADAMIGSGYDQLKASAKTTAAQMEKGLNNYTIETLLTMKDNQRTLVQSAEVKKIDNTQHASVNQTTAQDVTGKTTTTYNYSDPKISIWKNGTDNKYYESAHLGNPDSNRPVFSDPFESGAAPELEKIVDALVGNLKEDVQAEAAPDGGREYSGSLTESQVPTLVNAVASFWFKERMVNSRSSADGNGLPDIVSDVYVKKVTGTAVQDKAGLLENVTGDIVLAGKDSKGAEHDLSLNVVFKLSGINATKVSKPDLSGQTVEQVSEAGGFTNAYVGTYKNNIVMEQDGKFVKIGERTLTIAGVQDGKITGRYAETVIPGFEADYPDPYDFTFTYDQNAASGSMSLFTYTNPKGEQEKGRLTTGGNGKVYLELNVIPTGKNAYSSDGGRKYYDSEFIRVFSN